MNGATSSLRKALRATEAGQVVEEVGQVGRDLLVAGEEAEVLVQPSRDRVVVPGADVRVAPQPAVGLAPHDQGALGVDLQRRKAVDDVDACRLELARPLDVAPLVEARLQLDQADRLLALLGGLDQRRHVRRVLARAVDGRLHRHASSGRSRRCARTIRTCGRTSRTDGGRARGSCAARRRVSSRFAGREARRHHRDPRVLLELGPVERDQLVQLGQVEQTGNEVDLVLDHVEAALQLLEHPCRARARDLDAHRIAEASAAQLELDRLEQVVRLVGDGEVGIASDAERRALDDLHHREEPGEEVADHPLERHEQAALADRQEARQQLGHLDAREPLLAGLRVADEEAEAEREARDVRERLARARPRAASARGRSRCRRPARAPPAPPARGPRSLRPRFPEPRARAAGVRFQSFACSAASAKARLRISASAACGVSPSGERTATPAATWSIRPATRTMKNSSMFAEKIAQKLTRSSSGIESSRTISSTRPLKSSCDSSRFRNLGWASAVLVATTAYPHGARRGPWVTKMGPSGYVDQPSLASVFLSAATTRRGQRRELQLRPELLAGPDRVGDEVAQRLRLARRRREERRSVKVEIG